jgi:hypothetical protein
MATDRTITRFLLAGSLLGLLGACSSSDSKTRKLFINELQASNQDIVTDEYGEADDWIEIFNADDATVDLNGYRVSDSSGTSQTVPGSLLIQAGGFVLLWADGSPSQGGAHLGFKLGAKNGDSVRLTDPQGNQLDKVSFGPVTGQSSYARFPDGAGAFAWCTVPTPGASNGAACGG